MSVLNLPIKRQKELARLQGMSHPVWVETTRAGLKASKEFLKEVMAYEREAEEKGIKPNRHMYDRMMSENPPPGADIVVSS